MRGSSYSSLPPVGRTIGFTRLGPNTEAGDSAGLSGRALMKQRGGLRQALGKDADRMEENNDMAEE